MVDTEIHLLEQCEKELAGFRDEGNEIRQHLLELGYLSVNTANSVHPKDEILARQLFEKELLQSGLFKPEQLAAEHRFGQEYFLRYFLRKLTDIDDGLVLGHLPEIGETGLRSRFVHYRLDLFGMWEHPVSLAYGMVSALQIGELAEVGKCTSLEAINYLANVDRFTRHLLASYNEEQFILAFRSVNISGRLKEKLDRRFAFGRQLKDDFGEKTEFLRYLQKHVLNRDEDRIDYGFLEKESKNPLSRFLVRLIQVHQWQEGFYSGLLDSDLGEVSLQSLIDSVETYNLADGKDIKMHRVLTYLGNGYFMFNALFFLQEYMVDNQPTEEQKLWENLAGEVENADDESREKFTANLQQLRDEVSLQSTVEEKGGFLKRIYFGFKKLIRKAFRFLRKIFRWVLERIEKVWGFVKKLFASFFENLYNGLRAFVDGIKFLLGRKLVFTGTPVQFIISKISPDGDVATLVINAGPDIVMQHVRETRYQLSAMAFSLAVVGNVLKLAVQPFQLITWPLLLFKLVGSFQSASARLRNSVTN
ncbi:hypothetical protein [Gaoshiqia sediminis]|uniref:Uncharacterized protein n=1 Tax=Gaoshiqia sediminis TaxID=2986998 RepID=A0AA41Y9F4_9BACT|nr:hypothetical protein [Gaoshiqia sediminis]MCW0484584.1 hypothetical protein [Gaoshiqia sediminis]